MDAEGLPEHEYLMIRASNKQFVDEDAEEGAVVDVIVEDRAVT